MIKLFFSRCNRPKTIPVSCGSHLTPVYNLVVEDGVEVLKIVGQHNIYDFVQASEQDTLVYNILDRFARGDVNALLHHKGQFLDVTGMPTTLAEAQQLIIDVNEKFSHLPDDVRAKFHDNPAEYIARVAVANNEQLKDIFGTKSSESPISDKEGVVNVA